MLSVAFVLAKAVFHRGVESPDQIVDEEHIGGYFELEKKLG
jgi:hypothetical protein